jgi:hypothetical protein
VKNELPQEILKSAPPVAVTAVSVAQDMTLNQWVAIATLAYIVMQMVYLGWKWWREHKKGKVKGK